MATGTDNRQYDKRKQESYHIVYKLNHFVRILFSLRDELLLVYVHIVTLASIVFDKQMFFDVAAT